MNKALVVFEVSDNIGQLKLEAPDEKLRLTDCTNTESMFRIIQSIPSLENDYLNEKKIVGL